MTAPANQIAVLVLRIIDNRAEEVAVCRPLRVRELTDAELERAAFLRRCIDADRATLRQAITDWAGVSAATVEAAL